MSLEKALEKIEFAKQQNLQILDLSNLDLECIPSQVAELTQLSYLSLDSNNIQIIEHLSALENLVWLSLYNNQITHLTANCIPQNLKKLYLEYNNIQKLPIEIGYLKKLEFIGLNKNNLHGENHKIQWLLPNTIIRTT